MSSSAVAASCESGVASAIAYRCLEKVPTLDPCVRPASWRLARQQKCAAYDRNRDRLGAAHMRLDMAGNIADMPGAPSPAEVFAWVESLSGAEVLNRMRELIPRSDHGLEEMRHNWDVLVKMRDDAAAFTLR